jgi:hypothetical protein
LDLYQIAQSYKQACAAVEQLLKNSAFKITWIMEEIGLGRSAFYARLEARNWLPEHLEKFAQILATQPSAGSKGGL